MQKFSAIVLAAGLGKRMKSEKSKVLHEIAGKSMLARTLATLQSVNPNQIITVASSQNAKEVKKINVGQVKVQSEPKGTADATRVGMTLVKGVNTVAVLYGDDSAFYKPETIIKIFNQHLKTKATITFVTVKKENPFGLGRIIRQNGKVVAIVEEKDATEDQRKIKEVNDGLYFFEKEFLAESLKKLSPSPVTGEQYLTDVIELALKQKQKVETVLVNEYEWHGINTPEELELANEKFKKRVHFMGIGGAGASAVANIANAYGYSVSGCDLELNSSYLGKETFNIEKGHSSSHIHNINQLIVSPAVLKFDPGSVEIKEAKKQNIPVITWQQFQGRFLQKEKFVIAVAGAYGKSTTTAMISQTMIDQNLNPTCEVGAKVLAWGNNFRIGGSKYFVCEADEYADNFLNYNPDIAVILNLGWDHPDYFPTEKSAVDSYKKFIGKIKTDGRLIIASDLKKQIGDVRKDIKVSEIQSFPKPKLKIIGDFRKENTDAALSVANILSLDLNRALESIEQFSGLARRLEYKGQIGKTKFFDDYAVQPYTILKTADALKEKVPGKKVAIVLEPHTFTRIEKFFDKFVESLKKTKVDRIFITDIYPAREKGNAKEQSLKLTKKIGDKAQYSGSIEQTADLFKKNYSDFDVICSMGAGKSWQLWDLIN